MPMISQANWTIRKAADPDNTGGYDYAIIDANGYIIAECYEHVGFAPEGGTSTYAKAPVLANARMMRAAPKLYTALKRLRHAKAHGNGAAAWDEIMELAQNAIDDAEGVIAL